MVQRQPVVPPLLLPLARPPETIESASQAPVVNHAARLGFKFRQKREVIYSFEANSYAEGAECRSPPPSKKATGISKRRSSGRVTDAMLDSERQRLIALLASATDEAVQGIFPLIEAAVARPVRAQSGVTNGDAQTAQHIKQVGKNCTERRCRNGKLKLPVLPPGLHWPRKKYKVESRRSNITICEFLRSEWKPLIAAGYGELRWLRIKDREAARAIDKYERMNKKTGQRRQLPAELHFLREREVTDLMVAQGISGADARLLGTLAGRARRGKFRATI
jgi:hypothetical protein